MTTETEERGAATPVLAARRRARLTQVQLAAKAGISIATLANAERFGFVTERTAERIAGALGCRPEELLP